MIRRLFYSFKYGLSAYIPQGRGSSQVNIQEGQKSKCSKWFIVFSEARKRVWQFISTKLIWLLIFTLYCVICHNISFPDLVNVILAHLLVFFSLTYTLTGVTYYKKLVNILMYSHVCIQSLFCLYICAHYQILIISFWVGSMTVFDIFFCLSLGLLAFLMYWFYSSPVYLRCIEYLKVVGLLCICTFYCMFYCAIALTSVLLALHFLTELQMVVGFVFFGYIYLNYIILVKITNIIKIVGYFIYVYLHYIVLLLIIENNYMPIAIANFFVYVTLVCMVLRSSVYRYQLMYDNSLLLIKFLNKFYYNLLVFIHLLSLFNLMFHLDFGALLNFEAGLLLFVELILICVALKITFILLFVNKSDFFLWKKVKVVYMSSSLHLSHVVVLLFGFACFLCFLVSRYTNGVQFFDVDTFEYREPKPLKKAPFRPMTPVPITTNKAPQVQIPSIIIKRARKITLREKTAILELYPYVRGDRAYLYNLTLSYEDGLEKFREHIYRFGPSVRKTWRWRKWMERVRTWDYQSDIELRAGIAMGKNAYAYREMAIALRERLRYIRRGTHMFPSDLVRPLYDFYLIEDSGFQKRAIPSRYIRFILRDWVARKTLNTRQIFTAWDSSKRKIPFNHLLTVNRYFQMFYELSVVRKTGISLELCKFLVDLFEVQVQEMGVKFAEYVNVIDKMYTKGKSSVNIMSLLNEKWWIRVRSSYWWDLCQAKKLSCSADIINSLWTRSSALALDELRLTPKYPNPETAEMYKHLNYRFSHEKKARRHLFNYPFVWDAYLQRWVPQRVIPPKPPGTFYDFFARMVSGNKKKHKRNESV